MWNRTELKLKGRKAFRSNYWPSVLVGFLLALTSGSMVTTASMSQQSGDQTGYSLYQLPPGLAAFIASFAVVLLVAGLAISIFVFGPLQVGCSRFFLVNALQKADLKELGVPFNRSYINTVKVMFFTGLFEALWTLLFIIPGIIKMYAWRFVPYILAEKPDIDQKEARELSAAMMNGHKWNAFLYDLSFIGWYFLGGLTLGLVNLFYTHPYKGASDAELYLAIRTQS
ncbi:MAG: DUF975 family protein [Mogibacterium sp.]|nr:DUF975 family protein [Mogibacterium sp.]